LKIWNMQLKLKFNLKWNFEKFEILI
jgi:hypothetical protein